MKKVTCTNETCTQNGIEEIMLGDFDYVMCGVCHEGCELSELYPDPPQPVMGE